MIAVPLPPEPSTSTAIAMSSTIVFYDFDGHCYDPCCWHCDCRAMLMCVFAATSQSSSITTDTATTAD